MPSIVERVQSLLSSQAMKIEQQFDDAIERGQTHPAILLFDLADSQAKSLAVKLRGQPLVDEAIRRSQAHEVDAVMIGDIPLDDACALVIQEQNTAEILRLFSATLNIPVVILSCGQVLACCSNFSTNH